MSIGGSSDLSATYIPLIEAREFRKLKDEMVGRYVGLSFDGTSRLGEAVNLTGRYCSNDFTIRMRLLRFLTCKVHLKASEFASMLIRIVCTELSIPPNMVVNLARDSVLVNGAACRILQGSAFYAAENQLCIAHTSHAQ